MAESQDAAVNTAADTKSAEALPRRVYPEAGGLQLAADGLQDVVVVPRGRVAPDNHLRSIAAAAE